MTRKLALLTGTLLLAWLAASSIMRAQSGVSLAALDVTYTQDFNTLASTGTTNTVLPTGWAFSEGGTNANTTYAAGDGTSNAGNTYSFGATGSVDRALGGLRSGTLIPTIGAAFSNQSGNAITSLDIAYDGEQWRVGTLGRLDQLDFQYSLDATSLTTGTWVDVNALDFIAPTTTGAVGALNGETNQTSLSALISGINIPHGATFWVRWNDVDATSSDDGLSVDDFQLTPHGGNAPALSIDNPTITEGDTGTMTASFTVTVSTALHPGVTFDIATDDGIGPSAATTADGDYVARALSGVSIPAGQTTFTFDVTINGDLNIEPDETFFARVTSISGALVADDEGLGTIVNDDAPPPVTTDVVISQIYGGGGNAGATLTNDYVELFNRGTTTVSLAGWSVQYVSAGGSGTWAVTPLTGTIAPGGYYLVQEAQGAGGTTPLPTPDASGAILMAAGAGKVALQATATPIVGACGTAVTVDFVGYGGASCFEGAGPTSAPNPPNTTSVLRKRGGCFDSDNNNIDFSVGAPSPRNSLTPPRSCIPVSTAIHDIQGSGLSSAFVGQDVITAGIVTGIKSNGFFLQAADATADNDPATSEGVFVFTAATPAVAIGHDVAARGTVGEFFELTQVEASLPGDIVVNGTGATLPAAITLTPAILDPNGTASQMEPFEAMRVFAASLTSVAPTDSFGEIATVLTGVPRPLREPGIPISDPVPADPTSGVIDCCIPRFDDNPERIFLDSEGLVGSSVLTVTSNVVLTNVFGPLDFSFSAYKILPQVAPTAGANMSGVPVPQPAADEFTVGGFNIENLLATNVTQRTKAALAIRQLMRSPDVIGHIEILDQPTLQAVADQVNADAIAAGEPNPGYQAILILAPLGGTQNVGFLVKTSRVRIDSFTQELGGDTWIDPSDGQSKLLHDRPPLVLRATVEPLGFNPRPVIIVVNHTRSFIDVGLTDIEGTRVREKRTRQAEGTAGLLQNLQLANPGIAVISIGDYNAYQFNDGYTDPIAILKGTPTPDDQIVVDESPDLVNPNFVNLTDSLPASERYSFIFEGTAQALDHMLLNTTALSYVQRYAIARGNSDFPANGPFASDATRPERASDHDMPVAYFRFPPPSTDVRVTMTASAPSIAVGGQVTYTITVTNNGGFPAQNVAVSSQLPATLAFVSCTTSAAGFCGGTATTPTATFPLLPAGATETITVVAALGCAVPNGTSINMLVSATSVTADPDTGNNSTSATIAATNAPPTLSAVSASQTQLLFPLHQMVPITINYTATDACGPVTTTLSVTSDEPVTAPAPVQGLAGFTTPDWVVVNAHEVQLRAERSVRGDGRVYTIAVTATDAAGGVSTKTVTVTVPR